RDNNCPIIAYTAESQSEWEEEAFLHGVTHVLTKPIRARLLGSLLERLWATPKYEQSRTGQPASHTPWLPSVAFSRPVESSSAALSTRHKRWVSCAIFRPSSRIP